MSAKKPNKKRPEDKKGDVDATTAEMLADLRKRFAGRRFSKSSVDLIREDRSR